MRKTVQLIGLLAIACAITYVWLGKDRRGEPSQTPGPVAYFSQLPQSDAVEISYGSVACFGSSYYHMRLESNRLDITELRWRWSDELPATRITNGIFLGSIALSPADLHGLDNLLSYLRSPKSRSMDTTIEEVGIKQFRGGQLVAEEFLTDGSHEISDFRGIVHFVELATRLRQQGTIVARSKGNSEQ